MKVLIVSDIHGNFINMKKVIQNDSSFDKLLILGDILSGPSREGYDPKQLALFLNLFKDKIISVNGNCDFSNELLEFSNKHSFLTIPIDDKIFFMTHGHIYNFRRLPDLDYDVFLQGHTHVPVMDVVDGKIYLNPGSITLPRGNSKKSYILYDNGEFQLKDLEENKILKRIKS